MELRHLPGRVVTVGAVRRVVPHLHAESFEKSRDFWVGVLGLEVVMDVGRMVTLASPSNPTAQVHLIRSSDDSGVWPDLTVEVGDVDAVHAVAVDRGENIVYPITDESWGVRRFFVIDPTRAVLNVMSHRAGS